MRDMETIRKEISRINLTLRSIANKKNSKTAKMLLRRQRHKLITEFRLTQLSIANSEKTFFVDSFSQSVISLKCHKSRYLRNSKGYFNSENYLIAKNFVTSQRIILKTQSNNITERDINRMRLAIHRLYGNDCLLVTDNRHRVTLTLPKKFTQRIEREISTIKKPIYKILKTVKISEMQISELRELYERQFKKLGYEYLPLV